jgi:UDP:flavonoid glycosyltransferase YjiC (YdhE family)
MQGNLVCLHILPYNYPVLVKLLDQLSHMGSNMKVAPPIPWRQEFERYCTSIPSYYMPPLRVAFKRMGIPVQLIPDLREGLKPATANHLKQLQRQAKVAPLNAHSQTPLLRLSSFPSQPPSVVEVL